MADHAHILVYNRLLTRGESAAAVDNFANKQGVPAEANPEMNKTVNDQVNKRI